MLGDNIHIIIKNLRLTQKELAEGTGIAAANLNRIIKGHAMPNSATLEKIAKYLDIPAVAFFDEKNRDYYLAERVIRNLPEESRALLLDSRNFNYIIFGLYCIKSGLSLDEIRKAIDLKKENSKSCLQ